MSIMGDQEIGPKYKLDMKVKIGNKTISLNNKKSKLLQCINTYGSIIKASKETGIPYRTDLKNIEIMENELGSTIVTTQRGGKGGGGSSELTETGKQILHEFIKLNRVVKKHSDSNEIKGKIKDINEKNKVMSVDIDGKNIIIPLDYNFKVDDDVSILVSPDDIFVTLEPHESSVRNVLNGKITGMELKNEMVRLTVEVNSTPIHVDVTEYSREKLDLILNMEIFIGFNAASATIIKI